MVADNVTGETIAVGRKTRRIPLALERLLWRRDGGCRFPGCSNTKYVDIHHIVHWADGGETNADNTLILCSQHHTVLHEKKIRIAVGDDGFVFRRADGSAIDAVPATAVPKATPVPTPTLELGTEHRADLLAQNNRQLGLGINAHTGMPTWAGDSMDYRLAVAGLESLSSR